MRRNFVSKLSPLEVGSAIPSSTGSDLFCMPVEAEVEDIGNKAFDAAVKRGGGHFVTIKSTADTYMPVYYAHGKSYPGKVHHDKKGRHHAKKHVGANVDGSDSSSEED